MDVSIVITSYNYGKYLGECIRSCLNQEGAGLSYEVLVIDDGSTDNTAEILMGWENSLLRKFHIENSGIEVASNFGFKNAQGDYIVRVDADDLLLPRYLETMRPYIENRYEFIYSDYGVINENGSLIETVNLPDFEPNEISGRGDFLATGTLYRREILQAVGGYETKNKNSGLENYELILGLLSLGYAGKHVAANLFSYRRHSASVSITKREQIIKNGQSLFDRFSLGPYRTNNFHPYNLRLY